ncbi:hypothetical protein LIA77_06875 [Sarocladium implicatum]|nr:hypothetical protein LIA77_06875 [Sarocladium implicatum]
MLMVMRVEKAGSREATVNGWSGLDDALGILKHANSTALGRWLCLTELGVVSGRRQLTQCDQSINCGCSAALGSEARVDVQTRLGSLKPASLLSASRLCLSTDCRCHWRIKALWAAAHPSPRALSAFPAPGCHSIQAPFSCPEVGFPLYTQTSLHLHASSPASPQSLHCNVMELLPHAHFQPCLVMLRSLEVVQLSTDYTSTTWIHRLASFPASRSLLRFSDHRALLPQDLVRQSGTQSDP